MKIAIDLAEKSSQEGEVPVGAIVVRNEEVVGIGRNRRENSKNALSHAEIEAINDACKSLGGWRLWECEMYVTLEPCPMCSGAIINSRLKKVTFGAFDDKNGAVSSVLKMFDFPFTHKPQIEGGVLEDECRKLLSDFFKELRRSKK